MDAPTTRPDDMILGIVDCRLSNTDWKDSYSTFANRHSTFYTPQSTMRMNVKRLVRLGWVAALTYLGVCVLVSLFQTRLI